MSEGVKGRRFRPTLWASLATLACLAMLLSLGSWQVQRKVWKEGLIAERHARMAQPPIPLPGDLTDQAALAHRRVTLAGRFRHDLEVRLANRTHDREVGRHVLTPFETDDGRVLMVDRGWVPMALERPEARAAGQVEGKLAIAGTLQAGGWAGLDLFEPANEPDRGLYNWLDLPTIAARAGLPAAETTLYLRQDPWAIPGGYPLGIAPGVHLANNHLNYAIIWYAMAVILMVIYFLFHWRPADEERDDE